MKLLFTLLLLSAAWAAMGQPIGTWHETPEKRASRMKWWKEARFGMFVHFGLYAIPAGKWGAATGHGEWIRETAQIPVEEYEKLKAQFNPVKFDAEAWVRTARDAGMKYIVVTTKHHDGFGLFDSAQTDWCVRTSPYGKDLMRQIAEACRKYGMRIGWYHSIMDWHHPDYLPRRSWEGSIRPAAGANMDRFVEYLKSQLKDILTHYGPIDLLWFDGEWESTWTERYARDVYEFCRRTSPQTIINNRVSNSRAGEIESSGSEGQMGDYGTPEQFIPATGLPFDWETCMTMNDHWGFNAYDHNWKSTTELIRNLVDIASKGGNYLLNVGPRADGTIPPESVQRLAEIGQWMKRNGESIHGSTASPFELLPWGRCTRRDAGGRTKLFLHVFDWPKDGRLVVPGLGTDPASVSLLAQKTKLSARREGSDLVIQVPGTAPDPACTVIVCEFRDKPVVFQTPRILAATDLLIDALDVRVESADPRQEMRWTADGSDPTAASPLVEGRSVRVTAACTLKVATFADGRRVSPIASARFRQVVPAKAAGKPDQGGLSVREYGKEVDRMPDFGALEPRREFVHPTISLGYPGTPDEYVVRVYQGRFRVPETAVYQFELNCDDGGRLWIAGQLAVDHDGMHGASSKFGSAALAVGWHEIKVEWFNKTGGAALRVKVGKVGSTLAEIAEADLGH